VTPGIALLTVFEPVVIATPSTFRLASSQPGWSEGDRTARRPERSGNEERSRYAARSTESESRDRRIRDDGLLAHRCRQN